MIKFITDHPIAFISEKRAMVITDLHIGIENELFKSGILITPQSEKFAKRINRIINQLKARMLIILGDIKYEVPRTSFRELKQIPKFFEMITDKVKIFLTKGNHDTNLEDLITSRVKVYSSRGFKLGRYGFFHGHAWPSKSLMKCDYLFMGHLQPAVEFHDILGYRMIEQVWLKGKLDQKLIKKRYKLQKTGKLNIIIVPSFNRLSGSLILNRIREKELLGPLFTNNVLDISKCMIYLLDGTFIGKVENLL